LDAEIKRVMRVRVPARLRINIEKQCRKLEIVRVRIVAYKRRENGPFFSIKSDASCVVSSGAEDGEGRKERGSESLRRRKIPLNLVFKITLRTPASFPRRKLARRFEASIRAPGN
jgi:hypothetical protein